MSIEAFNIVLLLIFKRPTHSRTAAVCVFTISSVFLATMLITTTVFLTTSLVAVYLQTVRVDLQFSVFAVCLWLSTVFGVFLATSPVVDYLHVQFVFIYSFS